MGALKWGLKATLGNLRTIVYNCALLRPFWDPLSKGRLRRKMTTSVDNRGHLWTSSLSPIFAKPPFRLSRPEFPGNLRGNFGEFGLGSPVAGQGNGGSKNAQMSKIAFHPRPGNVSILGDAPEQFQLRRV